MLQKLVEDRKLLEEGVAYADTPKISDINFTRGLTKKFGIRNSELMIKTLVVGYKPTNKLIIESRRVALLFDKSMFQAHGFRHGFNSECANFEFRIRLTGEQ